jgi:hypothetical protein
MNTITSTTLHVARTDWAPHIEAAARAIATAAAFVYTAGYCTGQWLHNLNNSLSALLVRQPVSPELYAEARAFLEEYSDDFTALAEIEAAERTTVQRQAAVPHRAAIAAPRVHPAVALKAQGLSQRAIADKLGCTRYEVRKALKG